MTNSGQYAMKPNQTMSSRAIRFIFGLIHLGKAWTTLSF